MSLYGDYNAKGLTATQVMELRGHIELADESTPFLGGLSIRLDAGVFYFEDSAGPLCYTDKLDVALTIITAGIAEARALVGAPHIEVGMTTVRPFAEPEPQIIVEVDPHQQDVARSLAERMRARREAAAGAPVETTGEGRVVRTMGQGDGPAKFDDGKP